MKPMSIKSTVVGGKPKSKEWKFPCLGRSIDGDIVLFQSSGHGTLVYGIDLGTFLNIWNMSNFTPLDPSEIVQLKNEE